MCGVSLRYALHTYVVSVCLSCGQYLSLQGGVYIYWKRPVSFLLPDASPPRASGPLPMLRHHSNALPGGGTQDLSPSCLICSLGPSAAVSQGPAPRVLTHLASRLAEAWGLCKSGHSPRWRLGDLVVEGKSLLGEGSRERLSVGRICTAAQGTCSVNPAGKQASGGQW